MLGIFCSDETESVFCYLTEGIAWFLHDVVVGASEPGFTHIRQQVLNLIFMMTMTMHDIYNDRWHMTMHDIWRCMAYDDAWHMTMHDIWRSLTYDDDDMHICE